MKVRDSLLGRQELYQLSYFRRYIGLRGDFNTHIDVTFVCAAAVA